MTLLRKAGAMLPAPDGASGNGEPGEGL
jgi:hypothetical protein